MLHRRIIVVVVPPIEELDLVGPLQVFTSVNRLAGESNYSVEIVTNGDDLNVSGEGGLLTFRANSHLRNVTGRFDSVLLVCGVGTRTARDPALFAWLKKAQTSARRLGAVCVGAFLLAEAGLLDGRKATAHWKYTRELAARYPAVAVQSERLWVKDGNIYTSAGISAGIDLALAWVEEDCGSALAHEAARELVLFLRRPSSQHQLSVSLASQASDMKSIQNLQAWIADNLRRELSGRDLAERVSMSVRNFERVFKRELGVSPARYVLRTRLEAARRMLESSEKSPAEIARACGFSSADVMRRSFVRALGKTPLDHRREFDKM